MDLSDFGGPVGQPYKSIVQNTIISNNATESSVIKKGKLALTGIIPLVYGNTVLKFKVSDDGTNFYPLYDSYGAEVSITVGVGKATNIDPKLLKAWGYYKLVSPSAVTADSNFDTVYSDI